MSVNRPTDPNIKAKDIDNKLRLFGIYNAFANGKLPTNKQIDIALNSAIESKALSSPSTKLSEEGRHLVKDLSTVIQEAKMLLLTKNHDQIIQEFIWHTQQATQTAGAPTPNAPISKDKAQEDGQQALAGLRTLGTLIITNGQFRKLLNDATVLLRDMASDAAQNAGKKLQPSQDELQNIDRPAEDNTWHEAPDFSKDNLKGRAKETFNRNAPVDTGHLQNAKDNATSQANPDGSQDPRALAERGAADQQRGTSSGVDAQGGIGAGISTLRDAADPDNIPDEHKDRANRYKDKTKDYMQRKMPQERLIKLSTA